MRKLINLMRISKIISSGFGIKPCSNFYIPSGLCAAEPAGERAFKKKKKNIGIKSPNTVPTQHLMK